MNKLKWKSSSPCGWKRIAQKVEIFSVSFSTWPNPTQRKYFDPWWNLTRGHPCQANSLPFPVCAPFWFHVCGNSFQNEFHFTPKIDTQQKPQTSKCLCDYIVQFLTHRHDQYKCWHLHRSATRDRNNHNAVWEKLPGWSFYHRLHLVLTAHCSSKNLNLDEE